MDLSVWSEESYRTTLSNRLLLTIGAKPYRCEYCRCNFVSFRFRKEKYRSRRQVAEQVKTKAAGAGG
jgi:hypothetical protein